ncbi:MAG: allantoinase AllB [Deltaproteobacteria bacterium]|nr:allantoinase AllB [Deltaproteobacteria bacterium]
MAERFAIQSALILTREGPMDGAVIVDGERIDAIVPAGQIPAALPVVDVGVHALLPGLVDCHVHINEPGRTEWEGFDTGTRAAAAGGVTTLVDMPLNCDPVTTSLDAFETKLEATKGTYRVDVGFWGGVVPGNAAELTKLAERGVLGAKAFLCHSGIDDFPESDEATLRAAMIALCDAGIPLLAHAELDLGDAPCATGSHDHDAWLASRPKAMEDAAIALLIRLCRETGCATHIVHLSSSTAVPMLREARAEGLPITVETCPHYLCLSAETVPKGETLFKCAPPIREEANREALWAALEEGVIDFVISDHSPCTPDLKAKDDGVGDFGEAWGGIASLSLGLGSVWREARRRRIGIERVVQWMAEAPARFAGVAERKGAIAPGMDADLAAWDLSDAYAIAPGDLHFKHAVSPYLGREVRGRCHRTWLRGREIFRLDGGDATFADASGAPILGR